jgi:hypothetical protein
MDKVPDSPDMISQFLRCHDQATEWHFDRQVLRSFYLHTTTALCAARHQEIDSPTQQVPEEATENWITSGVFQSHQPPLLCIVRSV